MSLFRKKSLLISLSILCGLILLLFLFPSWTPAIRDANGNIPPHSIASLEQVELGGVRQSILIRGRDERNPILLFLHGGPGYPQIAYARKHQQELEDDFTVVNWDQRGSGKSYRWGMSAGELEIGRLVQDTLELTEYLKARFNQPKIYVVGHSWGSLLGIWAVQKKPEHFYAYIGIGQVADSPLGEKVSYQFTLEEAKKRQEEKAIQELEAIGEPPYRNPRKDTTLERKWVTAFGGSERKSNSYKDLIHGILWSPEYTWLDGLRVLLGDSLSRRAIMPQKETTNLFESVPELKVPVYICMGRYDYMTPSEVAYRYYEKLLAPDKAFFWFEESAHFPHFEEKRKFHDILLGLKAKTISLP